MNPRSLFAPSAANAEGLAEATEPAEAVEPSVADAHILDVGVGEIVVPNITEEITSWHRSGVEGSSGDVSVIENIKPVEFEEIQYESEEDMDEDEAYINDGHVAPLVQEEADDGQGIFV